MAHWLEEAEREELRKKQRLSKESAKIQDKMFRINQNYEANREQYEQFVEVMHDLCERANLLPAEKREPWKIIEFKPKETKLENHLYYASTSKRFDKTVAVKAFPFVKSQHYKHIHIVYFTISKEMGMAEVEIKDDYLAKSRQKSDDSKDTNLLVDDGLKRINVIFQYEIEKLDKDLAVKILDWLVFKADLKTLPFREEHFKYDKMR
jgi:hypothetical protein